MFFDQKSTDSFMLNLLCHAFSAVGVSYCTPKNNCWAEDNQAQDIVVVVVVFLNAKIVIVAIYQCSLDTFIFLVNRNYQLCSGNKHTTKREVNNGYFYLV